MFVVPIVQSCAVPTYDLMMTHHMLTQCSFPIPYCKCILHCTHVPMFQTHIIKLWLSDNMNLRRKLQGTSENLLLLTQFLLVNLL